MSVCDPSDVRPLIVTADERLLDDLLRLAAAAGVTPEVVSDPGAARRLWSAAAMVLVGADVAARLAAAHPPRREQILLVGHDVDDPLLWRLAVDVGAEQVIHLPDGQDWLVDRFSDTLDGRVGGAFTVAVTGGCGGAGATTFAAALGVTAARMGVRTLLLDGDPLGGGLDLTLGSERVTGCRWPELVDTSGRVSAPSLRDALPRVHELSVLSWDRGDLVTIPPDVMREVVAAGQRGHGLVVVDLPRRLDAAAEEALLHADTVLVVVPAEVRAVAATGRVVAQPALAARTLELVVRGPGPAGLDGVLVAEALALPLAAQMRPERGITEALDLGRGPWERARGPLARACRTVLARSGLTSAQAAA